jgi:hypothetical protein
MSIITWPFSPQRRLVGHRIHLSDPIRERHSGPVDLGSDGRKQVLLVTEVLVEGATRDVRGKDDVVDARAAVPA